LGDIIGEDEDEIGPWIGRRRQVGKKVGKTERAKQRNQERVFHKIARKPALGSGGKAFFLNQLFQKKKQSRFAVFRA